MNPQCKSKQLFAEGTDTDFAEMAHIIPASSGGPRDSAEPLMTSEDRAHHSNIAVLCANCHTVVDKCPETFPSDVIYGWKKRHAQLLHAALGTPEFSSRSALREYMDPRLDANKAIFTQYGPHVGAPSVDSAAQWRRHVKATVIPNNARMLDALRANRKLLTDDERRIVDVFAIHALEFEARHLLNDHAAGSTQFPDALNSVAKDVE